MGFYTGTATNHLDLLTQIRDLAVDPSEGWTVVRDTIAQGEGAELVMNIPAGGIIGFREVRSAANSWYNFELQGFPNFDTNKDFHDQVGAIPHRGFNGASPTSTVDAAPRLTLDNNLMEFWLSISPRRLLLVARVSTYYMSAYLGRILPLGSNLDYPLPLFVGGNRNIDGIASVGDSKNVWSSTDDGNTAFCITSSNRNGSPQVMQPTGVWSKMIGDAVSGNFTASSIWPYHSGMHNMLANADGTSPLFPTFVMGPPDNSHPEDVGEWLGYLEGVYATSHEGLQAESVISIGADEYLAFPNVFRQSVGNFWAIKKA